MLTPRAAQEAYVETDHTVDDTRKLFHRYAQKRCKAGFSLDLAHHALHVMSSRILGFSQDLFDDGGEADPTPEAAAIMSRSMADRWPHITELALAASHDGGLGRCDDDVEFYFGLDLILDGLDRLRDAQAAN